MAFGTFFAYLQWLKNDIMNRGKIVIYSQQQHLSALVAEIIGGNEGQVICCTSYRQMINTCNRESPSLVIILSTTPFMNGSELVSNIRATRRHRPLIYVITWQQSEQAILSLLECGADQYMTFPVCMSRLRYKAMEHTQYEWNRFS